MEEKIKKIKEKIELKSKGKCGAKWEFNGEIRFISPLEAKQFYNKILNLAEDVYENQTLENNLLEAIYGNGCYHELVNSDDVQIKKRQNIQMLMTKFRGIIFDFKRELIWSFGCM
ncbi:unnamed protein product [Meloidogyne enterolobii]|uniref:Uncharacterized protein n=1 Tax=Meloidogyne enterolobii TaxID=390850 RepID=A0ACB1ASZ8_MELEN